MAVEIATERFEPYYLREESLSQEEFDKASKLIKHLRKIGERLTALEELVMSEVPDFAIEEVLEPAEELAVYPNSPVGATVLGSASEVPENFERDDFQVANFSTQAPFVLKHLGVSVGLDPDEPKGYRIDFSGQSPMWRAEGLPRTDRWTDKSVRWIREEHYFDPTPHRLAIAHSYPQTPIRHDVGRITLGAI